MKKLRVLLAIVVVVVVMQSRSLYFRLPIFMTMPVDMVLQHHILPLLLVMIQFLAVMRVLLLILPVLRMRKARTTCFFAIVAILQWVQFIP
jgi:hypothetical protein